ncbi:MAG: pyruvate kinase [Gammaproteobacteria bacterium]|nr:pyruvate kinase [Gammaproteobacteria bacterium]MCY4211430.1 pyruvate kinase [Gammaproteobacteria bacterium]MCY4339082.1 pyruvate kinase [Gammaproteobacteria bacterium]
MRRTKIIATMGPATDKPEMLENLVAAGVDLFRINYSHQTHLEHKERSRALKEISLKRGLEIGLIADLQGPKIRLRRFHNGVVLLREGEEFTLDPALPDTAGDNTQVGVTYPALARDVKPGATLLIDDGRITMEVVQVVKTQVRCRVVTGGKLSDNKGINLKGGGLSTGALTRKDRKDLLHGVEIGADYFAISFVSSVADIEQARELLDQAGSNAGIIAKFERAEALQDATAIIRAADAIMIARGDLGVEIGDAALPPVQKKLIKQAQDLDRPVITATQMMESMIDNTIPTRAEVFDVANAILDGTDAVMLSGETSIGKYPDRVVQAMARICAETEKQKETRESHHRISQEFGRIDEAIAMSTMYAANHIRAQAIAALTETGSTCLWMSRISSGIPILAFTRHTATMRKVRLYRGVYPVQFDITHTDPLEANEEIIDVLLRRQLVSAGDLVLITKGDLRGRRGGTNNLKIIRVGDTAA